jgi:predicted ATPase
LFKDYHFISANRCGPIKYVDKLEMPEYHHVGKNGDLTINTLALYKDNVNTKMNIEKNDTAQYSLSTATSLWISYIMDGGEMKVQGNEKESPVLSVNFTNPVTETSHRSENVGFGYSYVLSIVVTALVAKPGSTVLIENPEAHLHPKAQSRITHLLSRLAEKGVQVMLETHSEHILNGFRLCALKDEFNLTNEDLSIYFFDIDYSSQKLNVLENGRIDNWPGGFFDQQERDLSEIMRLAVLKSGK